MFKNLSADQIKQLLEEAVTLGMGKGWTHNRGVSSRCCCSWHVTVIR
ncbi:hypothetical protein [Polyangium jinanense]|uniref:Uncharacterized protein n=1 Tax=Polyangium jinanense TaxID=2829994 RepID=A0A9X3X374_9BACT|nr:hypothetical protein [Polyangium jinanense]MDC3961121.1 hypothetical protein [Polyangium jinanense]MDC3982802.1 hypothetical protein [Polyangium jinanense]